ncbi:MAG: hypothetical protein RXR01_00360 [Thermoproteus sp.]
MNAGKAQGTRSSVKNALLPLKSFWFKISASRNPTAIIGARLPTVQMAVLTRTCQKVPPVRTVM